MTIVRQFRQPLVARHGAVAADAWPTRDADGATSAGAWTTSTHLWRRPRGTETGCEARRNATLTPNSRYREATIAP